MFDDNTEEYSEEKTVFDFEDDEIVLSVWIDKYADDPCYAKDGLIPSDPKIARNGLACGRSFVAKDGSGFGSMFLHEIIMTQDVVGLRDGVLAFMNGDIDKFGPFPRNGPYGDDSPFFTLELKRNGKGEVVFSATVKVPAVGVQYVGGPMSKERLAELYEYYSRIAQWFPPRPEA